MFRLKNQIIKFFRKILTLIIIVLVFDKLIGATLNYLYFKQIAGLAYRTTYSMDITKSDILIFGSSRANHHYVPEVFEEGLKMSYYNTGRDGNFILYNYAVFKAVLTRYTPKIIILDINPNELYIIHGSYDRLSSLLPYYANHPEIRSIVNLRSPYERIKLLSSIYPFNSTILTTGIGILDINKSRKPDNKGYVPIVGKMREFEFAPLPMPTTEIDSIKVQVLDSISKICFDKKINLFVCYSPVYAQTRGIKIDSLIKRLANKRHFNYLDFSNDPRFIKRPDLFSDINHLNNEGASIYSSIVLDSLKLSIGIIPIIK